MKIVINKIYGGFSLSARAIQRLSELRGRPCYFFKLQNNVHIPISVEEAETVFSWNAYTVPNPDEVAISQANFVNMTLDQRIASNKSWSDIFINSRPENRADPLLIQVVEELGEAANGTYAELKIVEIPDGVDWEIDEYDGTESVCEKHRSWN